MGTEPPSPTSPSRRAAWLRRGLVMLALGVATFYLLEVTDRVLMQRLARGATEPIAEIVELPQSIHPAQAGSAEGPGNGLLRRSVYALEGGREVSATITQQGWIAGSALTLTGDYFQLGQGDERQFLLGLQGSLAGKPARLLRVSNGRFLWTDIAWAVAGAEPERTLSRIDLRQVRKALSDRSGAAPTTDPMAWSRFGGLPRLLGGLEHEFAFGRPRRMELRGETVLAMVGRRSPTRLASSADGGVIGPRQPHHVVVALSESTLFPRLIEYREAADALIAAAGPSDDDLLRPSRRPMLKIELTREPGAPPIDPRIFAYRPSEDGWNDQTERELDLIRRRGTAIATEPTSGARRR